MPHNSIQRYVGYVLETLQLLCGKGRIRYHYTALPPCNQVSLLKSDTLKFLRTSYSNTVTVDSLSCFTSFSQALPEHPLQDRTFLGLRPC